MFKVKKNTTYREIIPIEFDKLIVWRMGEKLEQTCLATEWYG